jgi:hypothetical protein
LPAAAYFSRAGGNFFAQAEGEFVVIAKKDAITTVIAWELFDFMVRTGGLFSLFGGSATLGVGFFDI